MKRKILLLTMLGLSVSFGSMVHAHCGKCGVGDEKPAEGKMGKMTEALGLTPEQSTQIETIKKEKHEKIKAIHEETREKIKAVLTDEQKTKFEAMHQHGENHEHGMKCGPECKNGCTDECKMKKKMDKKMKKDKK
ncbi:MAG: Spy/CpxP family protein refolding chaperone [Elusimicrobiota bacterium]